METGKVSTHAIPILFNVPALRLPLPPNATIEPAIAPDNTWVVLTGRPKIVLIPIVDAATISLEAPWA